MDVDTLVKALEAFGHGEYVNCLRNAQGWRENASKPNPHPSRGFCLEMAELWERSAQDQLPKKMS